MTDDFLALQEKVDRLAQQLFGDNIKKCARFTKRLVDICTSTKGKDILLIHNPGGYGGTPMENLLEWERSVIEGISATLDQMGCSWLLTQYFRSGSTFWPQMVDLKEQTVFFFTGRSSKTAALTAELKFISEHVDNLIIILIGASQGAAFSNAVMRQMGEPNQIYSIELGIFFPHMSRRVITERTLAIDNNGVMPDPMSHRNLKVGFMVYVTAPFRWIKYRMQGKPRKFTYCINAPGHDYNWEYPEVQRRITDFLKNNFSATSNVEVEVL